MCLLHLEVILATAVDDSVIDYVSWALVLVEMALTKQKGHFTEPI